MTLNTEPPQESPSPRLDLRKVHDWLKEWQIYISLTILVVAITGAVYSCRNYRSQISPSIVVETVGFETAGDQSISMYAHLQNVGQTAFSLRIRLYAVSITTGETVFLGSRLTTDPLRAGTGRRFDHIGQFSRSDFRDAVVVCVDHEDREGHEQRDIAFRDWRPVPDNMTSLPLPPLSDESISTISKYDVCSEEAP